MARSSTKMANLARGAGPTSGVGVVAVRGGGGRRRNRRSASHTIFPLLSSQFLITRHPRLQPTMDRVELSSGLSQNFSPEWTLPMHSIILLMGFRGIKKPPVSAPSSFKSKYMHPEYGEFLEYFLTLMPCPAFFHHLLMYVYIWGSTLNGTSKPTFRGFARIYVEARALWLGNPSLSIYQSIHWGREM